MESLTLLKESVAQTEADIQESMQEVAPPLAPQPKVEKC